MRWVALLAAAALAGAAHGAGESYRLSASLAGPGTARASFSGTLTGGTLAWRLTFHGAATVADLHRGTITITLCRGCSSPARGKVALTAAAARLLVHGGVKARLRLAPGLLSGPVAVTAVSAPAPAPATTAKPPPSAGPAGSTWSATAEKLRGQNGSRFEFVCPPNASAGAGPVFGGGTESFADASAVCPAAVMTGDILLQAGGLVVIEIRPGQPSYAGTTSNGITSQSSGPTPGSFVVIHDS